MTAYEPGSVESSRTAIRLTRIRTDDWPERDRVAMFHELHGGDTVRVQPSRGEPLLIDATILRLPDLALLWGRRSALRSEFSDGRDRLLFNLAGPAVAVQFGREVALEQGDAVALSGSEPGMLKTMRAGRIGTLEFPRGTLLPLLKDARQACARRIAKDATPLQLLLGYLEVVQATALRDPSTVVGSRPAPLHQLTIAHIHDLAAMTLGAARDVQALASERGGRAARLLAIKRDILGRIHDPIDMDALAARHQVSARYVRMLFEDEGISMTEFVRDERLRRARSMLLSPRYAGRRIAEIAYAAGFNDLSYFNRAFRRRFGVTPREMRAMS